MEHIAGRRQRCGDGRGLLRGRETPGARLCLLLAAALGGTVLIVLRHGGGSSTSTQDAMLAGVLFSLASAVLYALFTLVSGLLSNSLGAGPATTCLTVVAAAVMALTAWYRPLAWPVEVAPEAWLLYLGVVTAALALLAFSWGAARLSPTALTVATLLEPLTAVLLSAAFLGERLSGRQWVGALLLLSSSWGLSRRGTSSGRPA